MDDPCPYFVKMSATSWSPWSSWASPYYAKCGLSIIFTSLMLACYCAIIAFSPKEVHVLLFFFFFTFSFCQVIIDTANQMIGVALLLIAILPFFGFVYVWATMGKSLDESDKSESVDKLKQARQKFEMSVQRLWFFQTLVVVVTCFAFKGMKWT